MLRTLVREGVVTESDVETVHRTQQRMQAEGVAVRLDEVIVREGILKADDLRRYLSREGIELLQCPTCGKNYKVRHAEAGQSVFCPTCSARLVSPLAATTLDARAQGRSPAAPREDPRDRSGRPFGRYQLLEKLGQGGMGIVWKAWDTQLKREVALKQILHDEAGDIERFMREARAAARLRHPGILTVHDVGVHEGHHYFTTDYVAGQSLDRLMKGPLPARRALEIVKSVGEALEYAHGEGIVHRDVKPANILMDAKGRPFLMDFGLAKEFEVDSKGGLTASGDLLGTPLYMSPEQAMGRNSEIGPASDQYSLGVVLYHLLTGRTPSGGENMRELLNAIAEQEPPRVGRVNPRIHRDVETICMKAIEKDPGRRYSGVGEFAADIGRYLEGEPIEARPVSSGVRLLRRAAKHKAIVLPVAAAIALGLALAGWGVWSARESERTKEAAVREERESGAQSLKKAARIGDVLTRWAELGPTLRQMESNFSDATLSMEEKRRRGDLAWPPIRKFVEETPSDSASQSVMLALSGWARRLAGDEDEGRELIRWARLADPDVPYAPLLEALIDLDQYAEKQPLPTIFTTPTTIGLGAPPAETAPMKELRIHAEQLLKEAEQKPLWGGSMAEDFRGALGALQSMQAGKYAQAEAGLSAIVGTGAMRHFRSPLLLQRGKARYLQKKFLEAQSDFEEIVEARPSQPEPRALSGLMRYFKAEELALHGEDPRELLDAAIVDLEVALRLDPKSEAFYIQRGTCFRARGKADESRGKDPRPFYSKAVADFDEALGVSPDSPGAHNNRGLTHLSLGDLLSGAGRDPLEPYAKAVADFDEALRLAPDLTVAYVNRGNAHRQTGKFLANTGRDPFPEYASANLDYTEAIKRESGTGLAQNNRGIAFKLRGEAESFANKDPGESFKSALADFDEALRLCPDYADAYVNRGSVHSKIGDAEAAAGRDPIPSYERAIADYGEALRVKPDHVLSYLNRGDVYRARGDAEFSAGKDPRSSYQRAIQDLDEAIRVQPRNALAYSNRGNVHLRMGEHETQGSQEQKHAWERALNDYDKAVEVNPKYWRALFNKGALLEMMGRTADAVAAYEAAQKINPSLPAIEEALKVAREKLGGK